MTTPKTTQLANGMADIANIALCDIALEKALSRTSTLPGLVCFYGPSGFGKSVSAAWVANRPPRLLRPGQKRLDPQAHAEVDPG